MPVFGQVRGEKKHVTNYNAIFWFKLNYVECIANYNHSDVPKYK